MKNLTKILLLALIAVNLSSCGQKGALTRPEPAAFSILSK